jgi:peptidyl-dipeptidase A
VELVKLRNEGARKVGFKNYHLLSLAVGEQDAAEVDRIFDELYEATKEPYARLKAEVDEALAKKYGISVGELRPWHYQDPFFQERRLFMTWI